MRNVMAKLSKATLFLEIFHAEVSNVFKGYQEMQYIEDSWREREDF